jgi:hypothetical protein
MQIDAILRRKLREMLHVLVLGLSTRPVKGTMILQNVLQTVYELRIFLLNIATN